MKEITIKRLEIENFKCFKNKVIDFQQGTTVISGMNAVGKSTLHDAVLWTLFDKNAAGDSAVGIRPHDEDGNDIHFLEISVAATFDVSGKEVILKKTQNENWVKDRASKESIFKGNVNTFEVNGIPKKKADYEEYVKEHFCDLETFQLCSSARSFFRLDVKKRREKLVDLAGDITDEDVISTSEEFEEFRRDIEDGATIDELTARSKASIKKLNENLKTLPARIDEQKKSKVDVNISELELARNSAKEKIAKIEAEENDIAKKYEEFQQMSDSILEIKFEMNELGRKANEDLLTQRGEINKNINLLEQEAVIVRSKKDSAWRNATSCEESCEKFEKQRLEYAELWKVAKERKFDENSLICPYCGQEYAQEKKDSLKEEFESKKSEELREIEEKGTKLKQAINEQKQGAEEHKKEVKKYNSRLFEINESISEYEKTLAKLPERVDISGNEKYQELKEQLAKKEASLAKGDSAKQMRDALATEKWEAQSDLDQINRQLAKAQRNIEIDERIEELTQEQREISQKIASEERMLDLMESFNKAKMNLLTENVNKKFKTVRWKLFEKQINGGYKDVCQAIVGGSNYETCLNTGHKIIADVDILQTFQKENNIKVPIWIDNAEAVNDFNLPETETQTILLKVSDSKVLSIN